MPNPVPAKMVNRPSEVERRVLCSSYSECLEICLSKRWQGFSCSECQDFTLECPDDPVHWADQGRNSGWLLISAGYVPKWIANKITSKAFRMVSQWVSIVPGLAGEWFRRAYLEWVTRLRLGDCCISFGTTFSAPRVRLADGVYLGRRCDIGFAVIGPNCVIGSGVHIISGLRQHVFDDLDTPTKQQGGEFLQVTVGEDCWIGNCAIIGADVGEKCVIGVGSVLVKPIPDFAIAAGNPARVIRLRLGPERTIQRRRDG